MSCVLNAASMLLRDKVVIIVGASGGIGRATTHAFAQHGALCVLAAPQDELLETLADEMRPYGPQTTVIPTDMTRRSQVDELVERVKTAFGRIDVLVNTAGVGSSPSLCDCTPEEIENVLAVNLLGAAHLMHAVLPVMKAQRGGSIINVGSVAGEAGVMGIYSASKYGLRGLSDSVRREVRSNNIAVTLIEPGFVRTPMNAAMSARLPGPEIVARAIVAAVRRPRRAQVVPAIYWGAALLVKLFPALSDRVFGDARIQERLNRDSRTMRNQNVVHASKGRG